MATLLEKETGNYDRPRKAKFWKRSRLSVEEQSKMDQPEKRSTPPWTSLFNFTTRRHIFFFVPAILCSIASGATIPVNAYLLGLIFASFTSFSGGQINGAVFKHQIAKFVTYVVINGGASWLFNSTAYSLWHTFGDLQARSARERLFNALLLKPASWYDRRTEGIATLTTRVIFSVRELQNATSLPICLSVQFIATFFGCFILAFYLSWKLTLVIIAGLPLVACVVPFFSSRVQKHNDAQANHLTTASKLASGAVSHIETVKCYSGEESSTTSYKSEIGLAEYNFVRQAFWHALQTGFIRLSTLAMFVQGFWFGSVLLDKGQITSGQIIAAFWAAMLGIQSLINMMPHLVLLEKGRAAGHRLCVVIKQTETDAKKDEIAETQAVGKLAGDIAFENVHFCYPSRPSQPALKGVNLFFAAGETTFLIGKSGSGKSTVGQLLVRFHVPNHGSITLDGVPFESLQLAGLRKKILLVEQESTLFTGTIKENLAMGHSSHDVDDFHIRNAAAFASVREAIELMSEGFDTKVGTKGNSLSGGQRQRVALARAWLRDPAILILDESTSALDHVNRSAVMTAIRKWRVGKTTIIITHDVSQIEPQDFVYVMKDGKVVQEGYKSSIHSKRDSAFDELLAGTEDDAAFMADSEKAHEFFRSKDNIFPDFAQHIQHTAIDPQQDYDDVLELYLNGSSKKAKRLSNLLPTMYTGPITPEIVANTTHTSAIATPFRRLSQRAPSCVSDRQSFMIDHHFWDRESAGPPGGTVESRQAFTFTALGNSPRRFSVPPAELPSSPMPALLGTDHLEKDDQSIGGDTETADEDEKILRVGMKEILKTIWPHFSGRDRRHIILAIIACVIYAVSTPMFSYVFSLLLQTVYNPASRSSKALVYSLGVLGVAVVDSVSTYFTNYELAVCGQIWINRLRFICIQRILSHPCEFFDKEENDTTRLTETLDTHGEMMQHIISRFLGYMLIIIVMTTTAVIWSFAVCWKLTAVLLACSPVVYAISYAMEAAGGKLEEQVTSAAENTTVIFSETFTSISTVRALTLESYFRKKHHASAEITLKLGIKRAVILGSLFGLAEATPMFLTGLVFYYGSVLIAAREFSLQNIFQVFSLLLFTLSSVNVILCSIPQMSLSRDAANRILRLMKLPKASHEQDGSARITHAGSIVFDKVNFSYPNRPNTKVLKDISLTISEGQCVALVGLSGSGKSTIASLLLKLYTAHKATAQTHDSTEGEISISSVPIQEIDTGNLRFLVTIVSQKPTIFPATVAQNITYGLRASSSLNNTINIETAARAAGAHEFISSLPQGYNTLIGDGGTGLSGGQAQRIAVARALIRRPNILILDEVTSALDDESAGLIRTTIQSLLAADREAGGRKMTVVMITHSREMMRIADKICMLEDGAVVESGKFESLMRKGGAFSRLFRGKGIDD